MEPMPIEGVPERLRRTPSWLLGRASADAYRAIAEGMAAAGGHRHHYSLLASLSEFGPASQADLGRRTGIDPSDMVAVAGALAQAGLIERTPDPADRRRNVVRVTDAGLQRLRELQAVVDGVQADLLGPLSAAERETLTDLLARLVAAGQAGGRRPPG